LREAARSERSSVERRKKTGKSLNEEGGKEEGGDEQDDADKNVGLGASMTKKAKPS